MDVDALSYVADDVSDDVTQRGETHAHQVELLVRCEEVASSSCVTCVLFGRQFGQWRQLARTEAVDNSFNPRFTETFKLKNDPGTSSALKFALYDMDCKTADLSKQNLVGSVETCLASLTQPATNITQTLYTLRAPGNPKGRGQIIIVAELVRPTRSRILLHLGATKFNKTGLLNLKKRNTCLEICRSVSESVFHPIHRTEVVYKNQSPRWRPCELSVQKLCNGDPDRRLQMILWHIKDNKEQHFSGSTITSLRELTKHKKLHEAPLMKVKRGDKKNIPSIKGYIRFLRSRLDMAFTLRDYIRGGTSLRFMLAVDFTSSNGDPTSSTSLHYIGDKDNEYMEAIKTIGGMLSHYDLERKYTVFGFGARTCPENKPNHCFHLREGRNPHCKDLIGVLDAYRSGVNRLIFAGPSLLAPVVREATCLAIQQTITQSDQQYSVLMVVTDGVVNDIEETIDSLIASCSSPLSIVIVGLGPADFSTMEDLLGTTDDPLTSGRTGQYATRRNVHFAAIKKDRPESNVTVGREAMASVSQQMVAYLTDLGITPNKPIMHKTDPTLGSWCDQEHVPSGTAHTDITISLPSSNLGPMCPTCGSQIEELDPVHSVTTDHS